MDSVDWETLQYIKRLSKKYLKKSHKITVKQESGEWWLYVNGQKTEGPFPDRQSAFIAADKEDERFTNLQSHPRGPNRGEDD